MRAIRIKKISFKLLLKPLFTIHGRRTLVGRTRSNVIIHKTVRAQRAFRSACPRPSRTNAIYREKPFGREYLVSPRMIKTYRWKRGATVRLDKFRAFRRQNPKPKTRIILPNRQIGMHTIPWCIHTYRCIYTYRCGYDEFSTSDDCRTYIVPTFIFFFMVGQHFLESDKIAERKQNRWASGLRFYYFIRLRFYPEKNRFIVTFAVRVVEVCKKKPWKTSRWFTPYSEFGCSDHRYRRFKMFRETSRFHAITRRNLFLFNFRSRR